MRAGIAVLSVMGCAWFFAGLLLLSAAPPVYAVPVIVSVVVFLAGRQVSRFAPPRSLGEEKRVRRLVVRWSMAEGVAIAPTTLVLGSTGLEGFAPAAIAIIVGLHFIPLARFLPVSIYYGTASALLTAGLAGLADTALLPGSTVALVCGLTLWITAATLVVQTYRRIRTDTSSSAA